MDASKVESEPHTIVVIAEPDNSFFSYFSDLMLARCEARGLKLIYHPTRLGGRVEYVPERHAGRT